MTSESKIRVRPMTLTDLDSVIAIANGLPQAPKWPREAFLNALDAEAPVRRLALVAEAMSAEVIGLAVFSLAPPVAELETVAIASAAQRTGAGFELLKRAIEQLRAAGIAEVVLEVRASNAAAIGLYRKLGFLETGTRRNYYADPVEDAILMQAGI